MFTIKAIEDERELAMLREFLLTQKQYYPLYQEWVDSKCLPRIEKGEYQALVVIADNRVVGDAVHQLNPLNVAIKNFRIDPCYRNRELGNCLMSQVEYLHPEKRLNLDVTCANFSGVEFFIRNGFHIRGKEQLYLPGQDEYLLEKLSRTPRIQAVHALE